MTMFNLDGLRIKVRQGQGCAGLVSFDFYRHSISKNGEIIAVCLCVCFEEGSCQVPSEPLKS